MKVQAQDASATGGLFSAGRSLVAFAVDIKLAHSIFALPFALSVFALGEISFPDLRRLLVIIICMVTARSFAMGMNRYLDRHIDARNPRTRGRGIPCGALTPRQGLAWSVLAGGMFVVAASQLSPLAAFCAPPLLLILMLYSYMKRWTFLTHWYLGICLGLAPVAVQVAMSGHISVPVLFLGAAVAMWTAGFDILYALQDLQFDRQSGLQSIPGRLGPAKSLLVSRLCFGAMIGLLAGSGVLSGRGFWYWCGLVVVALILVVEQILVRDARETGHSRRLNVAFFNANAYISVVFLAFTLVDAWFK